MKPHQPPRARPVQLPLIRHGHIIPARKRIRDPSRAHRIQNVALGAQDGRAQRLVFRLLDALADMSMVFYGNPALPVEDAREPFALVREEGDGAVDVRGHVDDDEEAVLGINGAEVAVVPVLPVAAIAFRAVDQGRDLRRLRNLGFGRPFEVGLVDVHADDHADLEFGLGEGEVLTVCGLLHWSLPLPSPVRD